MAARSSWTGAINFAGFPIHLAAYPTLKSKSVASLKMLSPAGLPVTQVYIDDDGWQGTKADCGRGIEVSKGQIVPLDAETVEALNDAERSITLEPDRFSPLGSVPLHLATGHFRMVPNGKVPGADGPAEILWNGLRATERALVTEWTPRAGSRPALIVIHADAYGLNATTLPYASDFNDTPEHKFSVNDQAAATFEAFVGQSYSTGDLALGAFEDTYTQRRKELLEKALQGEPIAVPAAEEEKAEPVPDLLAAMQASIQAAGGKPAKATKKNGRKKQPVAA